MPTDKDKSSRASSSKRADEFMSTTDAAKVLFVSRSHILKLIDQDKLKLHHVTGNNRFVRTDSVQAYQADQQAAIEAYQAAAKD
ncbi:excisionase family DNA-binding protein [Pandoraea sp. NPDC090278]|uniref:excisionase family DNA-binding protein n=1 Tax=Pandoraea sp. NPDC090278 TaxID=3364391 RepID=UPI00383ADD12